MELLRCQDISPRCACWSLIFLYKNLSSVNSGTTGGTTSSSRIGDTKALLQTQHHSVLQIQQHHQTKSSSTQTTKNLRTCWAILSVWYKHSEECSDRHTLKTRGWEFQTPGLNYLLWFWKVGIFLSDEVCPPAWLSVRLILCPCICISGNLVQIYQQPYRCTCMLNVPPAHCE